MSTPTVFAFLSVLVTLTACNTPPAALQVAITPEAPTTTEDLAAEITGELVDPDGDEVSTSFTWYQDDEARPDLTELTVPASETAKGQRWKLFVLPSDGKLEGPPSEAEILVLNTAPVVETLELSPAVPLTTEDVEATVTVEDADGDEVDLAYAWLLDGVESEHSDATLPAEATERGQVWTLELTPSDDEGPGTTVTSDPVSIDNSAPLMLSVTLAPTTVYEATTLEATAVAEDEDGDAVSFTYAWMVDGELVPDHSADTLTGEHFDKGQEVWVIATPNDGFIDGEPEGSTPVTVLNTAPSIDRAHVEPQEIFEASELSCRAEGWQDADGDPEGYLVTWYVNGAEASSVTCSDGGEGCLDGGAFDKGQNLSCALVPDDGEELGDSRLSDSVTALNTAPVIADASLSTTSPAEGDTLSVAITATDADGDSISYTYAWFVEGAQVATTATIDSNLFDKHQPITVEITPDDGSDVGATVDSDTATVINTAPEVTSLEISTGALYTDDIASAVLTTADADGDEVTISYAWTVDGVDPGVTSGSLDGAAWFDKHQVVSIVVTPNDGEDDGATSTSNVTVLNAPPTAPTLGIEPADPEALVDDIVCSIASASTDADGDSVDYSFAWEVDGLAYVAGGHGDTGDTAGAWTGPVSTTETGDTVPGEDTRDDQVWTCSVTPHDGEDDGVIAQRSVTSNFMVEPQISCGRAHTCYLDPTGEITCWGRDAEGQSTPPTGDFVRVEVADDHWSCALDDEGAITCWGDGADGRDSPPTGVFTQLSGGNEFMLALDDDGDAPCWGPNPYCGGAPADLVQVEAGEGGACGVNSSGNLACWGSLRGGVDATPSGAFTKVEYAWMHACALDGSGTVHCWGDDTDGMATPPAGTFCDVGVGEAHTCAMECSGSIQCWGRSDLVTPPGGTFIQMDVGDYYTCAVDSAGLVQCWGGCGYGQCTPPSEIAGP
jgi:hypothetical protein